MTSTTTQISSLSLKGKRTGHSSRKGKEKEISIAPSLSSLLQAGTLAFHLRERPSTELGDYAEDGWSTLRNFEGLRSCVTTEADLKLLDNLDFLQLNAFVRVTYTLHSTRLVLLRMYIIPWDLPGFRGVLRDRDDVKVMVPARKALRDVLMQTNLDKSSWSGYPDGNYIPYFGEPQVGHDFQCS